MEGGIPLDYFLGQKVLNGKGGVIRSTDMVKKPTILKKLAAFSPTFFAQSQGSGTTAACNESLLDILIPKTSNASFVPHNVFELFYQISYILYFVKYYLHGKICIGIYVVYFMASKLSGFSEHCNETSGSKRRGIS
jgi:hypothetical protein